MNTKIFAITFAILTLIASTQASLIWTEQFSYTDGALLSVSNGNWTAFSGAGNSPIQVQNNSATLVNVTNGSISGEDVKRALDQNYTSGVLYASALVSMSAAPTGANGDYFLSFYSSAASGGGYMGRIFASATATGWSFGLSNGTSTPVDWGTDLSLNTTYKIVLRLDVAARTATMGVFAAGYTPTSDSELTLSGGAASGTTAAVDNFAMRQGAASGAVMTEVISGIATGTSLSDVAGLAAVPEPGTVTLVSLGLGVGLWGLRRRRIAA